jgi:hypothetical protein
MIAGSLKKKIKEEIFLNFYLIHICIQCFSHFSPFPHPLLHPPTPSLFLPTPSLPGRNYFALISNFVEERL